MEQNQEKSFISNIINQIQIEKLKKDPQQLFLIGVAGIPGSGKTTFCQKLQKQLQNSQIVPMDGYHLYLKEITPEQLKIRGNHITFNKEKFYNDIINLKQQNGVNCSFPSFDHCKKDPIENDIQILPDTKIIIIEGLYLFLKDWKLLDLFDFKINVDCSLELVLERVIQRHLEAGISESREIAKEKVQNNDVKNAIYIKEQNILDEKTLKISTDNNEYKLL